ncbi:phosphate/phosphite/phosphonate ABC transporter substrate-binding protein [Actinocorallia lasiicapitis]
MRRTLATSVLLPLSLFGLAACGDDAGPKDGTSAASATCPNGKIRFGIEPYEDPAKLTPAYQALGKALEAKLKCPVEIQVVQGYSAEILAMQNGKLELGQFGPLGYVFANRRAGAEAVASFANPDKSLSSYKAGIWVPKDSPIQTIADLKGKKLALSEAGSTSGDALPRFAIRKAGMKDTDVSLSYAGGHPQALLALTNGKVDAAEINTQQQATAAQQGKFDASKYRQVWASDPIPNDPITVAKGLDPAFKKALTDALLSLGPQEVAQVGAFLDVEPGPLVAVSQQTYQPLFDLADTLGLTEKDA